jgi:hypothetical protein
MHIPTTDAAEIDLERMDQAINRLQIANEDNYDTIGVLSLRWMSDDTGSIHDTELFIN